MIPMRWLGRTLHRLSNRFRVAIIVLFAFAIRAHVFRRHQPGRQDKGCERLMTVPGIGPIVLGVVVAKAQAQVA